MAVVDTIQVLVLGGLAGALGQGARVIVGLKKVNDQAAADNAPLRQVLEASRIFVSLMIGFVAGALAAVALGVRASDNVDEKMLLGLLAAGYAGADFIEGLMNRALPGAPAASAGKADGTAAGQPAAVPPPVPALSAASSSTTYLG